MPSSVCVCFMLIRKIYYRRIHETLKPYANWCEGCELLFDLNIFCEPASSRRWSSCNRLGVLLSTTLSFNASQPSAGIYAWVKGFQACRMKLWSFTTQESVNSCKGWSCRVAKMSALQTSLVREKIHPSWRRQIGWINVTNSCASRWNIEMHISARIEMNATASQCYGFRDWRWNCGSVKLWVTKLLSLCGARFRRAGISKRSFQFPHKASFWKVS